MGKEFARFKILLIKEKDSDFYPFSFFSNLVHENIYLQTIEKIVLEPQHEKFSRMYIENESVFNMWKGFKLIDYDKEYSDKRNIEEVLNIFDNADNVQIPNLMMILNIFDTYFVLIKRNNIQNCFNIWLV